MANNKGSKLRVLLVAMGLALSFSAIANAQAAEKIEGFLKDSGFEYKTYSPTAWSIKATTGTVIIGSTPDTVVIGMIVAPKGKFKATVDSLSDLLKLNHATDFLKFGIDDDGDVFVRAESKLSALDGTEFNATLVRVVNGHAKAVAKLAPYIVK